MSIRFIDSLGGETKTNRLRFPAGETHIKDTHPYGEWAFVRYEDDSDLMALAMWADARHRMGLDARAAIPYLPGARQDRGQPLGAKVYADFINSMGLARVVCVDPHSDVMPALLNNCRVVSLKDLDEGDGPFVRDEYVGVIAPDVGARKRAESVAAMLGVPVYQASKHRDFATGQLSGFSCEEVPSTGVLLVVDDICDGGGTFLGLTEALPFGTQVDLWVTHGVFSKGTDLLNQYYRHIWTTDSVPGAQRALPGRYGHFITPLQTYLKKELYSL